MELSLIKEKIENEFARLLENTKQFCCPEQINAICLCVQTLLLLESNQRTSNIQQNMETDYHPLPKVEIRADEGPTEIYIDGKRL